MKEPPRVKCPTCRKAGDWFATPHGPFCSKRCKLIDLGKWLGEEHRIAEPLEPGGFQDFEEPRTGRDPDRPKDAGDGH
jgi:endogenous inhibitor of DNA gyrase (YacG/DUF329 family)